MCKKRTGAPLQAIYRGFLHARGPNRAIAEDYKNYGRYPEISHVREISLAARESL